MFAFNHHDLVRLLPGTETGTIDGRADYTNDANRYRVNYLDATGRAATRWIPEYQLAAVAPPGPGDTPPGG